MVILRIVLVMLILAICHVGVAVGAIVLLHVPTGLVVCRCCFHFIIVGLFAAFSIAAFVVVGILGSSNIIYIRRLLDVVELCQPQLCTVFVFAGACSLDCCCRLWCCVFVLLLVAM